MLGNRKLVLDTHCEVYNLIKPWSDTDFWDFKTHDIIPGAIYVIGRKQFLENVSTIRKLISNATIKVIFSNPAEGSETIRDHCVRIYGVDDLVKAKQILLIGGGDMDDEWPCLQYDSFLPKLFDYEENLNASLVYSVANCSNRPYKFLFLNGRARPHRKYLLERFKHNGLLNQAIWTNLDSSPVTTDSLSFLKDGHELLGRPFPITYLDPKYEVKTYHAGIKKPNGTNFVKHTLFDNDWGEAYLYAEAYTDTYFSVVTETVYSYPYSFRTEKIWKPILIGHPFIAVANRGYYRDLHRLGFRTFGKLIDETFDQIDNDQQRIERTAAVIEDLCQQDLDSFLSGAKEVCKYNQQHLADLRQKVRGEFPTRFLEFVKQHINE